MSNYTIETHGRLRPHLAQEWLLTNGIGGFASGTVIGCNTRRYHGLLCAATLPPLGRMMLLNRIAEALYINGDNDHRLEFSINEFGDTFFPRGEMYLRRFELGEVARWEYDVEGVIITREVRVLRGKNIAGIRYTIDPAEVGKAELHLAPMVSLRDFHGTRRRGDVRLPYDIEDRRIRVGAEDQEDLTLHVEADAGVAVDGPDWWLGHTYAIERARGLDDTEDLFTPGRFVFDTDTKASITLWASLEPLESLPKFDGASGTQSATRSPRSAVLQRLHRAADDFVVTRHRPDGCLGTTILAGYPWFSDWGRDTMIALPGLLLATKRFEEAKQVLSVFAEYASEGMIPNRFDDYSNEPHYNTVDASLWFIHAVYEYLRLSEDGRTFEEMLLPACREIIRGYREGTRFHIHMDPADGLVTQGDTHTQLTWMDAKHGETVFTPRHGKAVEINALWYNALVLMGERELAEKAAENFRRHFWISPFRGLCDVVDHHRRDMSLRPNQIFAASLPHSPLTRQQQHAVVEVVRRELLTPYGLRTLAASEPNYHGRCAGSPFERDKAYHNGTIWPWPFGAFLEGYLKVNDHSAQAVEQARKWLQPLLEHMEHQACIGQISEVFDGDEPHRPGGCFAQAWSVAEVLRLAVMLEL
jgi:predicted glycogen debranching enzyme